MQNTFARRKTRVALQTKPRTHERGLKQVNDVSSTSATTTAEICRPVDPPSSSSVTGNFKPAATIAKYETQISTRRVYMTGHMLIVSVRSRNSEETQGLEKHE